MYIKGKFGMLNETKKKEMKYLVRKETKTILTY